jgi:hypothetical protein
MLTAYKPPSIKETTLSCPYCHRLAQQDWFKLYAWALPSKEPLPLMDEALMQVTIENNIKTGLNNITPKMLEKWHATAVVQKEKARLGEVFFIPHVESRYCDNAISAMWGSQCFSCKNVALWLGESLIHPRICTAPVASPDLPEDIRVDVEEARTVLNDSPRASAALLRLAIEKLCNQLTGKPKLKLDDKIALLVQDGLHPRTQQALDAVRVIGNEAVHPGKMDLNDDRDTALTLFSLVDVIVHDTLTRTKIAEKAYALLPESTKNAILQRPNKNPALNP